MGRRRGGAAGRFSAWWALSALAGLDWPAAGEALGNALDNLRWFAWSDYSPPTGWTLNLAVENPTEGLGWAIGVVDQA
ncbi:MAG: hypothetical protein ACT4OP_08070, partial [Actinomycetota bacterium]